MKTFKLLMIGDVIGKPGIRALLTMLPGIRKEFSPDFIVVNGENAADGYGITEEIAMSFFNAGVDVISTGNHVWQQREVFDFLERDSRIIRPANYPPGTPGRGHTVVEKGGVRVGVINVQGRQRMWAIDCPFRKVKEIQRKIASSTDVILVDMHGEAPDEKEALAWDVDGHVSAVLGTHTHIQTADERILPKGTAFMTDIGATGPRHSVIGFEPETSFQRALTQLPLKNSVSQQNAVICGALMTFEDGSRLPSTISRVRLVSAV